ncbi:MAG: DUF72 domain-containing protein [Actinomycetota bacterium]
MAGTLYVGTSGFSYKEWKGLFYPEDLKDANMLSYYASRLPSVEINYTFHRQPAETTIEKWLSQTPEEFRFTLKAHQRITHWLRLAGADEAVSVFLERAKTLGERLGAILFQCPPTLRYDRTLIESFLAYLPPTFRFAMEFRHSSWEEARDVLASQGVAWCVAETDEQEPDVFASEPFAYLRLRKTEYSDADLELWAERVRSAVEGGRDVFCYFKHEEHGNAPQAADRLVDLVSRST